MNRTLHKMVVASEQLPGTSTVGNVCLNLLGGFEICALQHFPPGKGSQKPSILGHLALDPASSASIQPSCLPEDPDS
ncbi:hypothetical protein Y1Q_0010891 [Alligator mississippiensis]|uniref:Uncharacterized protein n=1 Tax=Alligator mississippiensis TaxID=8496 RepID=A0A151M787_ALLMI|nr:hypothetical protein Y1Q_0010891 [Alligator mississippiensis]